MRRIRRLPRLGRLLVALAAGGALFGIATAVQADIPDSGTINACYYSPGKLAPANPRKGALRVIDTSKGQTCARDETALSWNAAGVTGAQGPTGPTGATGPTGPTGPVGAVIRNGYVFADGTLCCGSNGFTVTHTAGTGDYTINFPAGTFNSAGGGLPAITVNTNFDNVLARVGSVVQNGDGSASFEVVMADGADHEFDFIINQHNGPQVAGSVAVKGPRTNSP